MWIDYDQSGSFEPAERVFAEPFTLVGPRAIVGSFVVPNTATLGVTRMRITVSETEIGTNISPCSSASYFYGETEDYLVTITAPPSCQAPVASVSNITTTSADVSWTCGVCTGAYYVEYGAPGFTPGLGATAGTGTVLWCAKNAPRGCSARTRVLLTSLRHARRVAATTLFVSETSSVIAGMVANGNFARTALP